MAHHTLLQVMSMVNNRPIVFPWIHQAYISANKEKQEMFFLGENINISVLNDGIRIKTCYKALTQKAGLLWKWAITAVTKSTKLGITKVIRNIFFLSLTVLLYILFTQPAAKLSPILGDFNSSCWRSFYTFRVGI